MQKVTNRFEPEILLAIDDFEKEFEESVTWDANLDFYPDLESATADNIPLVATVGIYLELPGSTDETVVSGSIYAPPFLESEQIYKAVFDSLVALREKRAQ
jgi:hypothetical protein